MGKEGIAPAACLLDQSGCPPYKVLSANIMTIGLQQQPPWLPNRCSGRTGNSIDMTVFVASCFSAKDDIQFLNLDRLA